MHIMVIEWQHTQNFDRQHYFVATPGWLYELAGGEGCAPVVGVAPEAVNAFYKKDKAATLRQTRQ
jgi:hypothetical protein